jgi:hypothetical protein
VEYAPNVLGLLFVVHDDSEVEAVRIAICTTRDDAARKPADKRRILATGLVLILRRGWQGHEGYYEA